MATIVDSYSESNYDTTDSIYQNFNGYGQSFTGDGGTLNSVKLYLKKVGTPTTNLTVSIYAHSGTFGTSSVPTGSTLADSDTISTSTLTTSFALYTFNFTGANKITLTNATKYVVVLTGGYVDDSNFTQIGDDASSPSHAGNFSYRDTATWFAGSSKDLIFYVYKDDGFNATPMMHHIQLTGGII